MEELGRLGLQVSGPRALPATYRLSGFPMFSACSLLAQFFHVFVSLHDSKLMRILTIHTPEPSHLVHTWFVLFLVFLDLFCFHLVCFFSRQGFSCVALPGLKLDL